MRQAKRIKHSGNKNLSIKALFRRLRKVLA
jgi:hypothetical protein